MTTPLEAAFDVPVFEEPEIQEDPIADDTYSLLQLGYLTDTVTIGTHVIRIRTLKIGEELNAALLANKYKDTAEEARAFATALVAGSIVSVDNAPLLGELLGPRDDALEAKFDFILANWHWEPINRLWVKYNELLNRVRESADELKKD